MTILNEENYLDIEKHAAFRGYVDEDYDNLHKNALEHKRNVKCEVKKMKNKWGNTIFIKPTYTNTNTFSIASSTKTKVESEVHRYERIRSNFDRKHLGLVINTGKMLWNSENVPLYMKRSNYVRPYCQINCKGFRELKCQEVQDLLIGEMTYPKVYELLNFNVK